MKKITLAILMLLGTFSMASAELGVNIGVSGQMGVFQATATEKTDLEIAAASRETQRSESAVAAYGFNSIFLEKTIGSKLAIGVDYVLGSLETDTYDRTRPDLLSKTDGAASNVTQKIQVDFDNLITGYVNLNLSDNFYLSAGLMSVDVTTNETLGTGSTYGNTSLTGSSYGFGYHHSFDNGMFVRAAANILQFDGKTLTSSTGDNQIVVDELNGANGKLSIGKSF
ncbi:hypothetical protein N8745_02000 [Candidatus Pelagibacter sp.]|nr:hypothetical protein [Candidatus Pelagibacter sp.]